MNWNKHAHALPKTRLLFSALVIAIGYTSPNAWAGDIEAGKAKAAMCASCHGANGISPMDLWPNLAGQKAGYLAKQMRAFRDGTRSDAAMTSMAQTLTDADIDNLSSYYNSLPGGG